MATNKELRRRFFGSLWKGPRVVWSSMSGLVTIQLALGAVVAFLERWSASEAIYFSL
jgi:hypothetical protein